MWCNERLGALLDHFNIFEATGWYWGWLRGPVDAEEYRLLEGSSEMASFISSRKRGVRDDRARLQAVSTCTGGLFGNR